MNKQRQLINLTEFEKSVLQVLLKVPKGRVTTYKALARAIRRPKAVRAVGNALNKNPRAPKVPCHRVITSTGFLGGYALGQDKKLKILKKEGVRFNSKGKIIDTKKVLLKI